MPAGPGEQDSEQWWGDQKSAPSPYEGGTNLGRPAKFAGMGDISDGYADDESRHTLSSSFDQVFEDTPVGTTVYTLIGQVRLPCSLLISSESIKASSQPFSVSHPSILFSFGFLKTLHHFNHNHDHQPHSGSGGFSAALHDQRGLFQRQPKFWRSHSYQGVAHYHLLIMHIIMH